MFENLSEKLQRAFKNLRGQGKLSEENMGEALREIRLALLEADVNVKVVKQFIDEVRAKAMGAEVMTALSPAEQVVKLVRDEMVEILGERDGQTEICLATAHGCADGRSAGIWQDHHHRQAGSVAQEGRAPAHAGQRGRLPPGSAPAVKDRCGCYPGAHLRRQGRRRGQYGDGGTAG